MACARCYWPYPVEILNPLIGSLVKGSVCGICAREMIAAIHGNRNHQLRGRAEETRLEAIQWRRQHPEAKPAEV